MLIRREDPEFWEWFVDNYAYNFTESGWVDTEFVKADGTFDTVMYEQWIESKQKEYDLTKRHT